MSMRASLFETGERPFVEAVARLAFTNPFGAQREREVVPGVGERLEPLLRRVRERIGAGARASVEPEAGDLVLYKEACLAFLYGRYADRLLRCITPSPAPANADFYGDFASDLASLCDLPGEPPEPAAHHFCCAFQIRRAHHYISTSLLGGSAPAVRLRAKVWESIFTHDLRRYVRTMYARMDETATLILGQTGTGKELVARSIGLCRYVPFDEGKQRFVTDHAASFHGLNLSALAPTVLESELFGHKRGSFTGAVDDKPGWLKLGGTLFLDEIGEIGEDIQVKLLRVIQQRTFQPVGATKSEPFSGKLLAATHQDLVGRIKEGSFRLDLFMRICGDRIVTPSLREMLDAAPGERRTMVRHLVEKMTGPAEVDQLTQEVEAWIDAELPPDHPWPGNVRELEQCVLSRLVHHSCRPLDLAALRRPENDNDDEDEGFTRDFREGKLTVAEVLGRYTTLVLAQTGSERETARRLGIDRRAVSRNVDHALLARLLAGRGGDGEGDG